MSTIDRIAASTLVILTTFAVVFLFLGQLIGALFLQVAATLIIGVYVIKNRYYMGSLRLRALKNIQANEEVLNSLESMREQNLVANRKVQERLDIENKQLSAAIEKIEELQASSDETAVRVRQYGNAVKLLSKKISEETQQADAFLQLLPLVEPRWAMPPLGRWALDTRSMLHLALLVEEHKPKSVVELGSGASTIWLSYLVEKYGGKVYSFDHLEDYMMKTIRYVHRHELAGTAVVTHAALEPVVIENHEYDWYCIDKFHGVQQIDLLIVDGPPAATGPAARYPALPTLRSKLSARSVVVLDDTDREDEQKILQKWMQENPECRNIDQGISRLSVLTGFGDTE